MSKAEKVIIRKMINKMVIKHKINNMIIIEKIKISYNIIKIILKLIKKSTMKINNLLNIIGEIKKSLI